MIFYVENETETVFEFEPKEIAEKVAKRVLESEKCPYEAQINLLITDEAGIQAYNREYRDLDKPTDVLSFPNLDYPKPSDFSLIKAQSADYFDPESKALVLGDIIICAERVLSQSADYGHSALREFAFLTAHSMLHLLGYDHMTEEEASLMEQKQNEVLGALHITRDK